MSRNMLSSSAATTSILQRAHPRSIRSIPSSSRSFSFFSSHASSSTAPHPPPPQASSSASSSSSSSAPGTGSRWTFHISTAFHGKPKEDDQPSSSSRRQRPARLLQGFSKDSNVAKWRDGELEKAPWGAGHDWFFVQSFPPTASPPSASTTPSSPGTKEGVVIGIADGVGGWEDSGIDPAHFSQALMFYCRESVRLLGCEEPAVIMKKGYEGVLSEKGVVAGSSTACIITLDSTNGVMSAANLGDSTFLLVRSSKVIHAQPSQTHYFNAPRQLSKTPEWNSGNFVDRPEDADLVQLQLRSGDVLLLVTDGFSDNVWPRELEQIIDLVTKEAAASGSTIVELAEKIAGSCCAYARICAAKPNKESPFEVEARGHNLNYRGGKVDDVCVVAVVIREEGDAAGAGHVDEKVRSKL